MNFCIFGAFNLKLRPEITHGAYIACKASVLSLKTGTSAVSVVCRSACFDPPILYTDTALAPVLRLNMYARHAI